MGVKPLKLLKSNLSILILIVTLGLFLRVYDLNNVPPGLTWDEAALGYNAYSILKTGRDEYGYFLPLTFKSFGDYKPALYSYFDIPFILFFGLNETTVRLPSILTGIGLIILAFLLVRKIFKNNNLALASALFISISPPAINFSRGAWESNVALFLNTLGLYLFLKALEKPYYFVLSSFSFSLSILCYQSSKIFVPIIVFGLLIFFWKEIKLSKWLIISTIILTLILTSVFSANLFHGQADRLAVQSLFAYKRSEQQIAQIAKEENVHPLESPLQFKVIHGEWFIFVRGLAERYFEYFSPKRLFVDGDYSPRHNVPDLGIFSFYTLIFLPLGFIYLLKRAEKAKWILVFWLFTATIPAVLSRDLVSMVRALNFIFPIAILEGFGLYFLINWLSERAKIKKSVSLIILLLIVFANLILFLDFYFVHFKKENAEGWLYGYKQIFEKVPNFSKYDKVVFTDAYGQPYIYYLFYTQYPPESFQKQAYLEQKNQDVGTVRNIDNINFRRVAWGGDKELKKTLLIGNDIELPETELSSVEGVNQIFKIDFPNGLNAFKVIEKQ